jgi:RimJ/RimL family protein N-acetyltransferase
MLVIEFRPFTNTDFDELISWVDSEELLMQFSGPNLKFPLTEEQLIRNISEPNRRAYAITETLTGKMIAYAEIYVTTENIASLDKIIIGDPKMRGKGIGLQIMQQLLFISFRILGTDVATLNVFDWNTSAIRCYEKAGFKINKDKTRNMEYKGESWLVLNMCIVRSEHKA